MTPDVGDPTRRSILQLTSVVALSSAAVAATSAQAQGPQSAPPPSQMTLGMVVFEGFQLLDVFGPLEMFGHMRDRVKIVTLGLRPGLVPSTAGPVIVAEQPLKSPPKLDIIMVPGGGGTRREVGNPDMIHALRKIGEQTPWVTSVCTGSAVLARTGLLDGRRATTNKRAYKWATSQSDKVNWVPEARWVEDGKYFTSSGISAGMDMALGLIAKFFGQQEAERVANGAEYHWNSDPTIDPFAKLNGLVS